MERIGAWRVTADGPVQLGSAQVELERHLEDWIEHDPRLAGEGLRIIARQMTVESGGRLDLLALDPQGRLVVIEVKRARLEDVALTQALTYAAVLARESTELLLARISANADDRDISLPDDLAALLDVPEGDVREVISVVIGAGFGAGTEALLDYLSGQFGVPLRAVSLQVFDVGGGEPLLVREITEIEQAGVSDASTRKHSIEAVTAYAAEMGVGRAFEEITAAVKRNDAFHPRPFLRCIMCAPVARRTRVLFTYEPASKGRIPVFVAPSRNWSTSTAPGCSRCSRSADSRPRTPRATWTSHQMTTNRSRGSSTRPPPRQASLRTPSSMLRRSSTGSGGPSSSPSSRPRTPAGARPGSPIPTRG